MLTLSSNVILGVLSDDDEIHEYKAILTSSDIKKEMKATDKSFLEVAQNYSLIGMDDNGNSYYV